MTMSMLETSDIFRSAYHVAQGSDLYDIRVNGNGRQIATFMIRGTGLDKSDKAYRSGKALVNPLQLRESLNHVRDRLFKKLHDNEGRLRNDKKRNNRVRQNRR